MTDLLATIVASRHLAPEPVVTDALVHLCSTSEACASAMTDLLAELCIGTTTSGLVFTGQDINPETDGRPDLVASDPGGVRLVVEAKFDAALTPAQTGGAYVQKLASDAPGALVFLVPRDRMRNVWRTVSVTPGGAADPAELPDTAAAKGIVSAPLGGSGDVLAVLSWESLLDRMDAAVAKFGDTVAAAEIAQVRGLVEWRAGVGWVPLSPDDLPQRVGRQLQAITQSIKSVCTRVSAKRLGNGTADGGFGRYIFTPSGKRIWVGVWLHWWDVHGPGPVWAQVSLKTPQQMLLTSHVLTDAGIHHHSRKEFSDVLIPLLLPLGAEQAVTENHLTTQVLKIIAAVDGLAVEVIQDEPTDQEDVAP